MPSCVVVIAGTSTGVGKTWVAGRLVERLREVGEHVAARKPVQSFDPADGPTDAQLLAAASGEDAAVVCPPILSYPVALAPPIAAEELGRPPIALADVHATLAVPTRGILVVEGVGGPRSPLSDDGDTTDLARLLEPDYVVLVAEPGLGAINAVCLGVDALAGHRVVVFLNRFDETDATQVKNLAWLREVEHVEVVTEVDELVGYVRNVDRSKTAGVA